MRRPDDFKEATLAFAAKLLLREAKSGPITPSYAEVFFKQSGVMSDCPYTANSAKWVKALVGRVIRRLVNEGKLKPVTTAGVHKEEVQGYYAPEGDA